LRSRQGGRLKSREIKGDGEYPALLYKDGAIDPQFYDPDPVLQRGLTYLRAGKAESWTRAIEGSLKGAISDPARRDFIYASGLDRGGSTIAYSAFNTIFLREHNRIAGRLSKEYGDWSDDRLFETARLINIHQILTIVVNDYISHIGGVFPFALDRSFAERQPWYRSNRISIEFNLLYRWHSLTPDAFRLDGQTLDHAQFRFNNALLEQRGVAQVITDASTQPAGRIGLFNTPWFLEEAERRALHMARGALLQGFNAYRDRYGLTRYRSIDDFADGPAVAEALKTVYGDNIDAVEFTVGLFAERRGDGDVMPETLTYMVANDAFTHILTNPILSSEVHCERTFSELGWRIVQEQASLADIVKRNIHESKWNGLKVSLAMD
jgi:prostaglandin-endoperoxide synthase 2